MINITETSREFTEVEKYLLTMAPSIITLKDVQDGTSIKVDGYLSFIDVKESTGEEVELLSIITPEKEVFTTQSATFKRSLHDIAKIMGNNPFSIIKISGETKAGRPFINCTLDVTSLT